MQEELPPEHQRSRIDQLEANSSQKQVNNKESNTIPVPATPNDAFLNQFLMKIDLSNFEKRESLPFLHQEDIEKMLQARFESLLESKLAQKPEIIGSISFTKVCQNIWNQVYSESEELMSTFQAQITKQIDPDLLEEQINQAGNTIFKLQRQLRVKQRELP